MLEWQARMILEIWLIVIIVSELTFYVFIWLSARLQKLLIPTCRLCTSVTWLYFTCLSPHNNNKNTIDLLSIWWNKIYLLIKSILILFLNRPYIWTHLVFTTNTPSFISIFEERKKMFEVQMQMWQTTNDCTFYNNVTSRSTRTTEAFFWTPNRHRAFLLLQPL